MAVALFSHQKTRMSKLCDRLSTYLICNYIMATIKVLKKCVAPCPHRIAMEDSHELCVLCLGTEHARAALTGSDCVHCQRLTITKLRSRLAVFTNLGTRASAHRVSGPVSAANVASANERAAAAVRPHSEQPILDTKPDLVTTSSQNENQLPASKKLNVRSAQHVIPVKHQGYFEMLDVVTRAVARLSIDWPRDPIEKPSRLNGMFLIGDQAHPSKQSLPFLPDTHRELSRSWKTPYVAPVYNPVLSFSSNVMGLKEHGYVAMPKVEQALGNHLSPSTASFFCTPTLPPGPSQVTSCLVGKAYKAAGQAGGALHTLSVLQAYQARMLEDLDTGKGIGPEAVTEVRKAIDLSLRTIKQTAHAIGYSMATMVVTERHLWLDLSSLNKRDKIFLLNAPISPSGLFGDAVDAVLERFEEDKKLFPVLRQFLPRRVQEPATSPSRQWHELRTYREDLKASVAARLPPPRRKRARRHARCFSDGL